MSKKVIRDIRPFVKTAIDKGMYFEISRINQTTNKLFLVKVDKFVYIQFLKSQRSPSQLKDENLSPSQIRFLVKNLLNGEIRVRGDFAKQIATTARQFVDSETLLDAN